MLSNLKRFDIFGHHVGVTYKGDGAYKTHLGAFVTLGFYVLVLINLKVLIV